MAMNNEYDDATVRLDPSRIPALMNQQAANRQPAEPPAPDRQRPRRTLPAWVKRWLLPIGAGLGVLLALGLLPWLMQREPGFTLVVKGAPPDSIVVVDDLQRGIPNVGAEKDGAQSVIRVHGLTPGKPHFVCVSCNGGGAVLRQNNVAVEQITSQTGTEVELVATCGQAVAAKLPAEIDYYGKMVLIPAGKFLMGENGGRPEDGPQREVNIDYDYYIDKYEVTNELFRNFSNTGQGAFPSTPWWDTTGRFTKDGNHPVVGVSWNDAKGYADWAGKQLPSEAEWEKAASWDARAQQKRRWPWGNTPQDGNVKLSPPIPKAGDINTEVVGLNPVNVSAYGVFDMASNVLEWTRDTYQPYPGSQAANTNFDSSMYVLRGGSIRSEKSETISTTIRYASAPAWTRDQKMQRAWVSGFRCVIRADDPKLRAALQNRQNTPASANACVR